MVTPFRMSARQILFGGIRILSVIGLIIVCGAGSPKAQKQSPPLKAQGDYEAVAEKVVRQCAGIRENDLVAVTGNIRNLELLENIAVRVREIGAFPLLMVGSDRMTRRMYDDVPAKYDSQSPQWSLKVAELATAWISVDDVANPGLLAHVPPERFAARSAAAVPMVNLLLKRNVRSVSLGNGIYPSSALAKQFGMPHEELARAFWGGVDTDYGKLQETGAAVKTVLAGGREVHITSPYGTDLRVRVEGRPVYVSDGVISLDDVQRGGPACQVWLPAGEVYLAPIPGTANGIVLVERQNYQDKEIVGMELSFKDGKLVSMKAKSGMEPFKARYDVAGEGKDEFAVIDIGINREVAVPPGRRMDAFMAAGMVAVNLGNNEWAGGANNSEFGWTCFLPNATLTVDGNVLVERGKLKDVLASGR